MENYGRDLFTETIKPDMKKITIYSVQAAQETIVPRPHSHELFGYDFMMDTDLNTWLIEVNASPAMDYSTVRIPQSCYLMVSRILQRG